MKCSMCFRVAILAGKKSFLQADLLYPTPIKQAITVINGEACCGEHTAESLGHMGQGAIFIED